MAGAGTGCPLFFRCSYCRRRSGVTNHDTGWRYTLTGRSRPKRRPKYSAPTSRSRSPLEYEYECKECGHKGWSCHTDVAERALKKRTS